MKPQIFLSLIAFLTAPAVSVHAAEKKAKPSPPEVPPPVASAAEVPAGFRAEVLMSELTYPSSIESDERGNLYIAEAGYSYGDDSATPRILRLSPSGEVTAFATRGLHGPINDLLWHKGRLYVSHRGKISAVEDDRRVRDLVTDLPSGGDHHNNQMSIGPDGKLYFGQGTVTNSGVVGPDNEHMGWLRKNPNLHDIPAKTIQVKDKAFESRNPLRQGGATAHTMAFHPFNSGDEKRTSVEGETKASGTILRTSLDGGEVEIVAWGLRNPYGLVWTPDGKLYATENGMDDRGSRPVANDKEDLYLIKEGAWYGWPDYASGIPVTDPQFAPKEGPKPEFVMQEHPPVEKPVLTFPKHAAATKLAVSPGGRFGPEGRLFIAFFGHMSPMTGETAEHGGHRVAVVDPEKNTVEEFFTKKESHAMAGGAQSGAHLPTGRTKESGKHHEEEQAAKKEKAGRHGSGGGHGGKDESVTPGPRRLMDVHFTAQGDALYVVDFGALVVKDGRAVPAPDTGVVWRIVPEGASSVAPRGGLSARSVR
jgi:glucose/arabinose dehydrogenase